MIQQKQTNKRFVVIHCSQTVYLTAANANMISAELKNP